MKKMIFRSIVLLTLFLWSGLGKTYAHYTADSNNQSTQIETILNVIPKVQIDKTQFSYYYFSKGLHENKTADLFEQTEEEEKAKLVSSRKQITGNSFESQFEIADQDYLLDQLKVVPCAVRQSNTGPTVKWFLLFEVFRI